MVTQYIVNSRAWPVIEAKRVLERIEQNNKQEIILETGYGPSGLPHIGTFGEVTRTAMVKFALEQLTDLPVRLIAFSDDLDSLRKVPDNVPNQDMLRQYLQRPLTDVPDPFGKFNSFGEHNNAMFRGFLDNFGFSYEYYSATECYRTGMFDEWLLKILAHHEEIVNIIIPTLGEERQKTFSPFLPVDRSTGKVLLARVVSTDVNRGTIVYINEDDQEVETPVTGGNVKLGWKVDWAMRWCAMGVDYEMYGKDLIPSYEISQQICTLLGCEPPVPFMYEHFLDELGQKISKSKGNGLSIEEWLTYGNPESLSLFMYQKPQTAKRLYFDVIPRYVDEWLRDLTNYNVNQDDQQRVDNPVLYVYRGNVPELTDFISYTLILNLITVVQSENNDQIWYFLDKYKALEGENRRIINSLLPYAINYNNNFIRPNLTFKVLNEQERRLFNQLYDTLAACDNNVSAEEMQNIIYEVGVENDLSLRAWFRLLYQALLGKDEGPRMGSLFKLLGLDRSLGLIRDAIDRC